MVVKYSNSEFVIVYFDEEKCGNHPLLESLDISKDTNQDGLNIWHLSNKYFETDVHICCCKAKDFVENFSLFTKMEAVLYVFENKDSVFEEVKKTSNLFTEESGPELRMIWEESKELLSDNFKDRYFSWCLQNQFELVENPEEDDDEEEDSFKVKYGVDRIEEALRSHMWTNHTLKERECSKISKEQTTSVKDTATVPKDEPLYQNGDSFEELFGKLQTMKEQAQDLEGNDRKDYAEKVAFAFMEALGIQDEDEDERR